MAGPSEHFDAIVVGSGFGGSVTAARLAEAGRTVCVLERGKPYPPNSFPRSPLGMKNNFWDPSEGLHGMFDLWEFDGLDAVCASGLGGGSLIYANVFLRKDERWFVNEDLAAGGYEDWPVTRADLDPHYDEVERRIGIQRYPLDQPPYDQTRKVLEYRDAARRLGHDWSLVPLAVTFANDGQPAVPGEPIHAEHPNLHGSTRQTCRLCGECDVGCNYGSKNTLDYTYLSDAWRAGADIRTRCEVRSFEPIDRGGYRVSYVTHDAAAEGQPTDTDRLERHTLTCDRLILSAGTLGSTWLMLRNRAALPGVTDQLGKGFSGNGDLLTFALRATQEDGKPRIIDPGRGPVITSAIRVPDTVDGGSGRGFYLEDAGYPDFANWILEMMQEPRAVLNAVPRAWHMVLSALRGHRESEIGGLASSFLGNCDLSSGMLPLLGMGRDIPDGNMTIKDERLEVDWSKHGASSVYFDRVRALSKEIATELGAKFLDDPIWHENRVVTVHSLGGCRMARTPGQGVVDPYGRVFGHPGLYIADGSVMPGPVGANPSLTIAALADRFATAMLEEPRAVAAGRPAPPPPPAQSSPDTAPKDEAADVTDATPVALSFTEEMKGYVDFGETDFDRGFRSGKKAGTAFMFHLTITAADVDRFIAEPEHEGSSVGWIESDAFGGRRAVAGGVFNLFVDEGVDPPEKRMLYRLQFEDGEGHPLTMTGFKTVIHGHALDVWGETTTLFTRVLAGHVAPADDASARVVASGIIHIHPLDFAKQLTTFRVDPHDLGALGRFGELFASSLWDVYRPRGQALTLLTDRVVPFTAGDGLACNVINVRGPSEPSRGPVLLVHGAGVRANIFRAPSGRNLVDVLVDEGYDVWLENWRASIDIPQNHWTLDQAAVYDHPLAVRTVCDQTGSEEVKAVIHCQGSTSFMMSAVAGLVPQVRTIVTNAVSIHPIVPPLAHLKLRTMVPITARLLGYLDPQWGETGAPWVVPKLVDAWIRLVHHECDNPVCKWSSYTYGASEPTLWRHENLNAPTHDWVRGEFAAVPLTFFKQILRSVEAGSLLSVDGHPELPADFAAQAPLTSARVAFLAGAMNVCFTAESQRRTRRWYDGHGTGPTSLHVFDGYGHLDVFMGQNAARDIFPTIVAELG